nr:MAG TPA: hypothetical protein [Crassvirales sp.]
MLFTVVGVTFLLNLLETSTCGKLISILDN